MESKSYTMDFAGRPLTLEFGRYCEQANGSVWVHLGDTVVMVNATMAPTPRDGVDFFPLAVDVEEKQYSVGKIPGGFIKREGRPSEKATLTCRLIDRPLRPLFEKGMRNDVQVVVTVLSVEQDVPPEIPAMIGSSIALAVSDIPPGDPGHDRFLNRPGCKRYPVERTHRRRAGRPGGRKVHHLPR